HAQLMERSAVYRSLLAGLDDEEAESVGDRIEALATVARTAAGPGTTAAAWVRRDNTADDNHLLFSARSIGAPSIGPGLGGGGGGWRANLAPTPALLARVAALPPGRGF